MSTEADTCRKFVVPKLQSAGWDSDPHSIAEQRSFTDGRIVVRGNRAERKKKKRADYLLRYTRDFPIAVTEAKVEYKKAADGLQPGDARAHGLDDAPAPRQGPQGDGGHAQQNDPPADVAAGRAERKVRVL